MILEIQVKKRSIFQKKMGSKINYFYLHNKMEVKILKQFLTNLKLLKTV